MKYQDFIITLAKQMQIPKEDQESMEEWSSRVCYSGTAKHMLAGLFDKGKDNGEVSIQHIKERGKDFLRQYCTLLPYIDNFLSNEEQQLEEYLYQLYKATGFLYHSAFTVAPAVPRIIQGEGIMLYRGFFPSISQCMSGAGPYLLLSDADLEGNAISVSEAFSFPSEPIALWWQHLLQICRWYPARLPEGTEYLIIRRKKGDPYWRSKPGPEPYTLAQFGLGEKQYLLCHRTSDGMEQAALQAWQVQGKEYLRIANALLYHMNVLPPIRIRRKGAYVIIRLEYLLPPAEQNFLELYSWPENLTKKESYSWNRIMKSEVYPTFEAIGKHIGYHAEEEN